MRIILLWTEVFSVEVSLTLLWTDILHSSELNPALLRIFLQPGFVDYKGLLQTACARAKCELPRYELETEGLSHEPLHRATVRIGSQAFKGPYKPLKKDAEHAAARSVWEACLRGKCIRRFD